MSRAHIFSLFHCLFIESFYSCSVIDHVSSTNQLLVWEENKTIKPQAENVEIF